MEKYFPVLARYNTAANRAMYNILGDLPEERLTEEVGSYYGSIFKVLNHIYGSDVIWLQRMRKTLLASAVLPDTMPASASLANRELEVELTWPTTEVFESFGELRPRREALDALVERFTAELDAGALETVIDYRNSRGERKRFVFWQALMHFFNHQTHHRGQIAEILDQFGVANDYSNIIATLREPPVD